MAEPFGEPIMTCGTCEHYRRNSQVIGAGHCWCMPPAVIPVMAEDLNG